MTGARSACACWSPKPAIHPHHAADGAEFRDSLDTIDLCAACRGRRRYRAFGPYGHCPLAWSGSRNHLRAIQRLRVFVTLDPRGGSAARLSARASANGEGFFAAVTPGRMLAVVWESERTDYAAPPPSTYMATCRYALAAWYSSASTPVTVCSSDPALVPIRGSWRKRCDSQCANSIRIDASSSRMVAATELTIASNSSRSQLSLPPRPI